MFVTGRKGQLSEALSFNSPDSSNDSYVTFPVNPLIDTPSTQSVSISLWFNASAASLAGPCLLMENRPGQYYFQYGFSFTGGALFLALGESGNPNNGATASSVTTVTPNAWHHAAMVYDGTSGQVSLYLDGNLESQSTSTNGGLGSSPNGNLFFLSYPSLGFTGSVEQVRIYNRTLSSSELMSLYQE